MQNAEIVQRRKTIKNDVSSPAVLIRKTLINNVKKQVSQLLPGSVFKRKTTMQKIQDNCEYQTNVVGTASLFSQYLSKTQTNYD